MPLASMDPQGTWYFIPRRTGLTGVLDKYVFRQAFVVEEMQRIMDMHPDWLTQTYPQGKPSHAY